MSATSRFDSPSASLTLKSLVKGMERAPWVGLVLAVGMHGALTQLRGLRHEQRAAKPLTTQFVKRQPRLTKPLELKKRPQPRRRQVRREMVSVQARIAQRADISRFQPALVVQGLSQPSVAVPRTAALALASGEPRMLAQEIQGAKEARDKVDLSLELLSVDGLDTGQYHALVVQDPRDKRNIKGFLHLAILRHPGEEIDVTHRLTRLADAMNRYTDVRTDVLGELGLDSPEVFMAPWVFYYAFKSFTLTASQLDNLGRYLLSGGFVFADAYGDPQWRAGLLAVRSSLLQALAGQGVRLEYERLPNAHPMYHCYFDFDTPPPGAGTSQERNFNIGDHLEGLVLRGRLLAAMSERGYFQPWFLWGPEFSAKKWAQDNTRQHQFAVNTIIFALTQEGSITRRLMDSIQ